MCGGQGFKRMPLRDEVFASPASLDILMNVSMHMQMIWVRGAPFARGPAAAKTDIFLFFQ